jgi:hypothetical protein
MNTILLTVMSTLEPGALSAFRTAKSLNEMPGFGLITGKLRLKGWKQWM